MFVLFVGPPVLTGPLWCGPENPRTALRSLGVAPKTGPQRSGPVWFAVLAVPFRGLYTTPPKLERPLRLFLRIPTDHL